MLKVFPFASGSEYTASFALTASRATRADFLAYVATASFAPTGTIGPKGLRGTPEICEITYEQYLVLLNDETLMENCQFPPRDT